MEPGRVGGAGGRLLEGSTSPPRRRPDGADPSSRRPPAPPTRPGSIYAVAPAADSATGVPPSYRGPCLGHLDRPKVRESFSHSKPARGTVRCRAPQPPPRGAEQD